MAGGDPISLHDKRRCWILFFFCSNRTIKAMKGDVSFISRCTGDKSKMAASKGAGEKMGKSIRPQNDPKGLWPRSAVYIRLNMIEFQNRMWVSRLRGLGCRSDRWPTAINQ